MNSAITHETREQVAAWASHVRGIAVACRHTLVTLQSSGLHDNTHIDMGGILAGEGIEVDM